MKGNDSLRARIGAQGESSADNSLIPDRYELGERYTLGEILGQGAVGRVYAARDTFLARDVALKVPWKRRLGENAARGVLDEARAVARLESEHVARVLDAGKTGITGLPYIVMERLAGVDLAHLGGAPLAPAQAIDYVIQACEAIAEAHALGMVHRDIKPSNLFLATRKGGPATLKVLDFGLADFATRRVSEKENEVVGTPHYMAPEVINGGKADARSDVWSLGVVLYELVAGAAPYDGQSALVVWTRILATECPRLDTARPHVPRALADVVARCMSKDPAARYANATELGAALAAIGAPVTPRPVKARARSKLVVALGLTLFLAAVVALAPHVHAFR